MSDTPMEIAENKWIEKHLFRCGTCKFKKKGYCENYNSDCYEDLVDDACSCDEYVPQKGLYL